MSHALVGAAFPPGSSLTSLSGAAGHSIDAAVDLQQLTPARGRQGIEEVPFQGREPVPTEISPPPPGGWGYKVLVEDDMRRFHNRHTQGIDGGARSTNIERFTPQLIQYQQPDDASRWRLFERLTPSQAKSNYPAYP